MNVGERPWGSMLYELGAQGFTGQIAVATDKAFTIIFDSGAVTGAGSPLSSDSVVRAALTGHLISSSAVAAINRRIAACPERDELAVLAETAKLSTEHETRLRSRVVMHRASRTFALEDGTITIREKIRASTPCIPIDVRTIVYQGAKLHMSEQRLANELRNFGSSYTLRPEAKSDLARFGFADQEQPIIEALHSTTSIAELELKNRELDPRMVQAVIYALVACDACHSTGRAPAMPRTRSRPITRNVTPIAVARTMTPPPFAARTVTPIVPPPSRTMTPVASTAPAIPRTVTPVVARTVTPTAVSRAQTSQPAISPPRATTRPPVSRTMTPRATAAEVAQLVATRLHLIEQGADYYTVLGLAIGAPPEAVRAAYLKASSVLHPARLAESGYDDTDGRAARLLDQLVMAHTMLTDPTRRAAYEAALERSGEANLRAASARVRTYEDVAPRAPAEEAFHRGQQLLRADQPGKAIGFFTQACELDPTNQDYVVLRAWAQFCAAHDREAIAQEVCKVLAQAIRSSDTPETAHLYLGRIARMLGHEREAMRHFREVLEIAPAHLEAQSELRVLETRQASVRKR